MQDEQVTQEESYEYTPEEMAFLAEGESSGNEAEDKPEESEIVKTDELKTREELQETKEEKKESPKTVPLSELIEERRKRQARDEENRILRERTDAILKRLSEPDPVDEVPPSYDEDPAAHIKWQNDQLLARAKAEEERKVQETEEYQQREQLNQVWNAYQKNINDYAEQTPEYPEAAKFLLEIRDRELEQLSSIVPEYADPAARMRVINEEAFKIGVIAMHSGKSPGQIFHELAKLRGFKASVPETSNKMATVRKGQEAAISLSNTTGGSEPEITAESLIAMSDDDFLKFTSGKKWKKLHGGKS